MLRIAVLAVCLSTLLAGHESKPDPKDPLLFLPALPKPALTTATRPPFDPSAGTALGPGVRLVAGERVVLDGTIQIDKGPSDGLEVLACLREGKTHEALVRLAMPEGTIVKAACLAAFGLPDGRPAEENRAIPARGTPLRLQLLWKDEDGWHWIDASSLVRDRRSDRPFPMLPYVWTGSRTLLIAEAGADGKPVRRERFMLDCTRSLAVNYDEPDALLASPYPCANEDTRFEVNSALCPPAGTQVHLALLPARCPLELHLSVDGTLRRGDAALDEAALATAMAATYGPEARPELRAVLVRTATAAGDEIVVAARGRLLAAAIAAKAWCVPLFQPE